MAEYEHQLDILGDRNSYSKTDESATLLSFLTLHQARFGSLPEKLCADAGYGSEENYELMERLCIEAFVKYAGFHKEQKRGFTENPFLQENLYYNEKDNYFVCPMGQHMVYSGIRDKVGSNGHVGKLSTNDSATGDLTRSQWTLVSSL